MGPIFSPMSPTMQIIIDEVFITRPHAISVAGFWYLIIAMWLINPNSCVPPTEDDLFEVSRLEKCKSSWLVVMSVLKLVRVNR